VTISSSVRRKSYFGLRFLLFIAAVVGVFVIAVGAIMFLTRSHAGKVQDEAKKAGRTPESMPAADEDYFHAMDSGVTLSADEVKGRNNWIVWTGGNDRLWDLLTSKSVGTEDLLKTISSYPGLKESRDNRWSYLGLINEPCFEKATGPDPKRFGLWLDKRKANCPADPFENEEKYPGVKIGARGKTVEVGSYYGYATGVVGLRLFPNPAFDEEAKRHWDPVRYYTDPSYYNDRKLVKPYRVGVSCGFCHVGPNPLKPPADPEDPQWENLSSLVGAQYFWMDRILDWDGDQSSFIFQLFHTSRPGTLDTSLVSTDNINNPRTMNAIYDLKARLAMASKWGQEKLASPNLNNKQLNDYVPAGSDLARYYTAPDTVHTTHVLKDGSDSVGVLGALNRVYVNIGLFSEEWLEHFNALIGGEKVTPIEIAVLEKNSTYWKATENQTPSLALFMLKAANPHYLADAPGGTAYLTHDQAALTRGKIVFAERCARCHSSKLPEATSGQDLRNCDGKDYLSCFNRYWQWTKTEDFKSKMRDIVLKSDFLKDNYLSTDARIPITLLGTNACSPLATNAIAGNIWDNFSSQSYKELPSVGSITVQDPYTGKESEYQMPGGGRGYTRVPSLINAWATAPFLLNNTLGHFESSPGVAARMSSFNDAIEQLLWPEKRAKDSLIGGTGPSEVDRTTRRSYLRVTAGFLPEPFSGGTKLEHILFPWLFSDDGIEIGPIPAGTPVNLLVNLDLVSDSDRMVERLKHNAQVLSLIIRLKDRLKKLPPNATDEQVRQTFADVEPELIKFNKCPDFVVNRGHYFGTDMFGEEPGLNDSDKKALIEFIKTF
jgi:hypothetical protein